MASPLSAFPPIHSLSLASTQENPPQDNAAKVIQKLCRGYLARVHTHYLKQGLLDSTLFEQTKALLEARSSLADMPQASAGKTTVYLPKELPIVLKLSGSPANYRRFHNMQALRLLCEKKGLKHLLFPKPVFTRD